MASLALSVLEGRPMRAAALFALFAFSTQLLAGCNASLETGATDPVPSPYDPNLGGDPGGNPDPNGGGGGGMNCAPGTHYDGVRCVNDELTCAAEFPCPDGQQCVGGRCIAKPGP